MRILASSAPQARFRGMWPQTRVVPRSMALWELRVGKGSPLLFCPVIDEELGRTVGTSFSQSADGFPSGLRSCRLNQPHSQPDWLQGCISIYVDNRSTRRTGGPFPSSLFQSHCSLRTVRRLPRASHACVPKPLFASYSSTTPPCVACLCSKWRCG